VTPGGRQARRTPDRADELGLIEPGEP
jgi:hypothetical protein